MEIEDYYREYQLVLLRRERKNHNAVLDYQSARLIKKLEMMVQSTLDFPKTCVNMMKMIFLEICMAIVRYRKHCKA